MTPTAISSQLTKLQDQLTAVISASGTGNLELTHKALLQLQKSVALVTRMVAIQESGLLGDMRTSPKRSANG